MTKLVTPVRPGDAEQLSHLRLDVAKATTPTDGTPQRVPLQNILKDESLQVRSRVKPRVVRQYAEAMQTGAEFPPVTLAHIAGSLYLVDGWHRVEAAISNNEYLIWANVVEMTLAEARWQAAKANTQHGLPLKTKEYREVFRAFIESGHHRHGHKLMPYREIAKHIGKGFSTIRNWMKADYPKLFNKYRQMANGFPEYTALDSEAKAMQRRLVKAEAAVRNSRNIGRTLDRKHLGELIQRSQGHLERA